MTTPTSFSAEACCEAGERHLKSGAPLLAYDVLAEALQRWPGHVRLRQLLALAMARSGASRDANAILQQLVAEGHADEETLGILARTHKDIALDATDPDTRRGNLELAFRAYAEAYNRTGGYYSGINAATMAVLLDRADQAAEIARGVKARCVELLSSNTAAHERYWLLATLGEASLVLGSFDEAEHWYRQAAAEASGRPGDLVSTRRNARLLLQYLGQDVHRCDRCFDVPRVAVFVGHLIDRPDRATPRFPPDIEPLVSDAIDSTVAALRPQFGYASAACGGDILFLESMERIGASRHVVLPYNADQFRRDSVDIVPTGDWSARFDAALAGASEVTLASDYPIGDMSFEYAFRMLDGTARVRADELETDLTCIALWDGEAGDGPGGTSSSVEHWRRVGRQVEIIDLAALRQRAGGSARHPGANARPVASDPRTHASSIDAAMVGLLFGDAVGFSRLTEPEMPLFIEHYLGTVARLIASAAAPPLQVNTWGDGLYLVFESVAETGRFALALSEAVRGVDWKALGFRNEIGLRIGLHAGPAYTCFDPVTGRRNYLGAHVSRAARIEPIAPPGEVYASGAFAALARSEQAEGFRCSYVGQTPLAKDYGTFPTYVLRRRT